jgi:hypothetical protein
MMPMRAIMVGPELGYQEQGFDRRLPFRTFLFRLRQLHDVCRCVLQRYELLTLGGLDWLVEGAGPGIAVNL